MGNPDDPAGNRGKWMALTAALLGWMFDGLEMGLFPLVARPALRDLLGEAANETYVSRWFAVATAGFLVGAATGGVLFGWLGDRLGRVRAMTLSVMTYAVFSGLCGIARSAEQVAALRFISALGMGGEWSLGVALVMEVWPNRSRALLAGLIGAAANFGYMLIALLGLGLNQIIKPLPGWLTSMGLPEDTAAWLTANSGWRILLLLGATPALLTFFIRLFVPESERWHQEKERGSTNHWAAADLFGVLAGAVAAGWLILLWAVDVRAVIGLLGPSHAWSIFLVGSLLALAVATLAYLYPVIRYLQRGEARKELQLPVEDLIRPLPGTENRIRERPKESAAPVPEQIVTIGESEPVDQSIGFIVSRMLLGAALSGVALLATWASIQWAPVWADQLTQGTGTDGKAYTQLVSALGAIFGTIAAALLADWVGRRIAYFAMCLTSLGSILLFFQGNAVFGTKFLLCSALAGFCTASFYGWLPLYLPELFPTRVRATGQGFSFNFGRILAAVGVMQTGTLMGMFSGGYPQACSIMGGIYLVGAVIIWFAPETHGKMLPE